MVGAFDTTTFKILHDNLCVTKVSARSVRFWTFVPSNGMDGVLG